MVKIVLIISLVSLFGVTGAAPAAIFTIELPELIGQVGEYPNWSTTSFDFGTSFLSIEETRIHVTGTASEGLAYGDGIFNPKDQLFEYLPLIEIFMYPDSGSCYAHTDPLNGLFDIEIPLALKHGATWDFLLHGQGQITANRIRDNVLLGLDVEPASVEIFEVYLIVEGTPVPEAGTLFLVGFGAAMMRKKR